MKTKIRLWAGSWLSYINNHLVAHTPSRHLRSFFLKAYLCKVGSNSHFQMGVKFLNGRKVSFGNFNVINFDCLFDGRKYPIEIGNNTSIGPRATLLTLGHDPQSSSFEDRGAPIIVEDYAWIGYGATVLPGVTIGEGAVIGANAVVTKSVEPYSINVGNPARKVGERNKDLSYNLNFSPFLL